MEPETCFCMTLGGVECQHLSGAQHRARRDIRFRHLLTKSFWYAAHLGDYLSRGPMTDAAAEVVSEIIPNAEEKKLMIKFPQFKHGGKIYDLSHLDPRVEKFIRPGTAEKAAVVYNVNVIYTQHPFTRDCPSGRYDKTLECRDGREVRIFDVERWELSKQLPQIVRELASRSCHHTKKNNFVTAEMVLKDGKKMEYDIFFVASKAARPGYINLIIQSAYLREKKQAEKRESFFNILFSALNNKKLKP